ncbi:MAG TPA: hypothetical protein VL282_06310 [Tepidisphaeraceae bacterium]|jgi:hypothetical protein|nr:hypothetical protein [Tepidisphaeraceae bacterium]
MLPRRSELPTLINDPRTFIWRYRFPLLVLAIGAMADVVTTCINLQRFGSSVEAHLAQRMVSDVIGVSAGVPVAKLIQLGFVLFVAAWWRPWCAVLLGACGVLYTLAAVSNHFLLL